MVDIALTLSNRHSIAPITKDASQNSNHLSKISTQNNTHEGDTERSQQKEQCETVGSIIIEDETPEFKAKNLEEIHPSMYIGKQRMGGRHDNQFSYSCSSNGNKDGNDNLISLDLLKEKLYHRPLEEDQVLDAFHRSTFRSDDHNHYNDGNFTTSRTIRSKIKKRCRNKITATTTGNNCTASINNNEKELVDFILISGPSGVGKTRLALSLKHHLATKKGDKMGDSNDSLGGFFLTCKFDQFFQQRREPYTAFVMAFTEFTHQILQRGGEIVKKIRSSIHEAGIGKEEEHVLIGIIPAFAKILQASDDNPANISDGAAGISAAPGALSCCGNNGSSRFSAVFSMFIAALSSSLQPMILILADLQWADKCSLEIVKSLIIDSKNNSGLVVVGTCDEQYVAPQSHLPEMLRQMEDIDNVFIQNVAVKNLSQEMTHKLIMESLPRLSMQDHKKCQTLSDLVFRQTNGNNFYIYQFVCWLVENRLLHYDSASDSLKWDKDKTGSLDQVFSSGTFLITKLQNLPEDVKKLIKVASCLGFGSRIDVALLKLALGRKSIASELKKAVSEGVFVYKKDGSSSADEGIYAFSHSYFQLAAYCLIPEDEKESFHLRVGRQLWSRLDGGDELAHDRNIFVLLCQLNLGGRLIKSQREKDVISALCLQAAKHAATSSAFVISLFYLNFGLSLLCNNSCNNQEESLLCWRKQYELCLALYNATAEVELVLGNRERASALLEDVFVNVNNFHDQIQAYSSKIYLQAMSGQHQDAIHTGLYVLRRLGETFPSRLCMLRLLYEIRYVQRVLLEKSDEQILRMPMIEDRNKLSCMQILNMMFTSSLITRPKLAPFLQLRWLKLTLKYGLSIYASSAFGLYGTLCAHTGKVDEGFRFGQLSLVLLEKFQTKVYLPRVHVGVYACINIWKVPIRDTLEPLLLGYRVGLQTGDNAYAFVSAMFYTEAQFVSGVKLQHIQRQLREICNETKAKFSDVQRARFGVFLTMLRCYRGFSSTTLLLDSATSATNKITTAVSSASSSDKIYDMVDDDDESNFDVNNVLQNATEANNMSTISVIKFWKMIVAYDFGNYKLAGEMADSLVINVIKKGAGPPKTSITGLILVSQGLIYLELARTEEKKRKRKQYVKKAKQCIEQLKVLSRKCPYGYLCKLFLLEAELASTRSWLRSRSGRNNNKSNKRKNMKNLQHFHEIAYNKFICSIALASEERLLYDKARATERLAYHIFRSIGSSETSIQKAMEFFNKACTAYAQWGSKAKVNCLKNEMEIMQNRGEL